MTALELIIDRATLSMLEKIIDGDDRKLRTVVQLDSLPLRPGDREP